MQSWSSLLLGLSILIVACKKAEPEDEWTPLLDVEETHSYDLQGLTATAYVIRTEGNVPHVYARDRADLSLVHGFIVAQDRFFTLDMSRRLARGTVSELLGEDALETDMESRGQGMAHVTDKILDDLAADPELAGIVDYYATGINHYIQQVKSGVLPAPSEYELAKVLLGAEEAWELMTPFERIDIAACLATIVYQLGYETGDARRGLNRPLLDGLFDGQPLAELRNAGVVEDLWTRVEPVFPVRSAPGWVWETEEERRNAPHEQELRHPAPIPESLAQRLSSRLDRIDRHLGRNHDTGFGSNVWAVAADRTVEGRAILAGDGHLPLTVAPLFYQIGMDTQHLGNGHIQQMGMVIPGMPIMGPGTNGHTAWSQTQLFGDITDWYREEMILDDNGYPSATRFDGGTLPLQQSTETYVTREIPLLGSEGLTLTTARWTTQDGRWIADIEGRDASADTVPQAGESLVNLQGDWVIPGDTDGDGIITAISFDHVALDGTGMFKAVDAFGQAHNVDEWMAATDMLVGYSQNMVVADASGSILYSGYQAVPCRHYLDRNEDGSWAPGADPASLLDGTQYGGFTIPRDGFEVDESFNNSDAYRCVVPWSEYPWASNPTQGFLLNANNDPAGISVDGSLTNDLWYIGGPWLEGYRADTIEQALAEEATASAVTVESMKALQANHTSRLGEQFVPYLLTAIELARSAHDSGATDDTTEGRMAAMYASEMDAIDEVESRLTDWGADQYQAKSGVETFYSNPEAGDADMAVATMIFNAWYGRFLGGVFNDEGLPSGIWTPTGDSGRQRSITRMLEGRGSHNSNGLTSWNDETGESAFFDDLSTDVIETSNEVMLSALIDALVFLRSPATDSGEGGFGTDEMSEWLWGYRHWVRFESLLTEFLGDDPTFSAITDQFAIAPDLLPLMPSLEPGDPRRNLPGFPRNGDQLNVDAANPGVSVTRFDYGSGPVFRMVISLGPEGPEGHNILPGGQSGLTDSPYFSDQAELWLGNQTIPMRFTVDSVLEGAVGRETFHWSQNRGL